MILTLRGLTFQYMLLLRGATQQTLLLCCRNLSFNTCSSCEEQLESPHIGQLILFQYMLLLRGATQWYRKDPAGRLVSIHAPLARSNNLLLHSSSSPRAFQYMLLLRGATKQPMAYTPGAVFQYMLLLRGATKLYAEPLRVDAVSIHAPLARSNYVARATEDSAAFQYMLLLRGATGVFVISVFTCLFQYMLLLRGATAEECLLSRDNTVSIHAPLARSNIRT